MKKNLKIGQLYNLKENQIAIYIFTALGEKFYLYNGTVVYWCGLCDDPHTI